MKQRIDGDALRECRVRAGYSSVEALAKATGWSECQIRRIEKERRKASRELYVRIIGALGLKDGDLLLPKEDAR